LKRVFHRARSAFLEVLDEQTIADFLPRAPALIKLWKQTA
jgi:DNA-binding IscR family transcriptional regulator